MQVDQNLIHKEEIQGSSTCVVHLSKGEQHK